MNEQADLSTREKIMHMLKTQGSLSAKDLTEQLGITSMAVRRHIGTLEKDHLIQSRTLRQPMGRPTAVYSLSSQADSFFPKNYNTIALDLLGELAAESGEVMVNRLFERRKETLQHKYESRMENMPFHDKVSVLADIQNENGYMAELAQTSDHEYVLTEYNCPIAQVANNYTHACTCERRLFESLLDAEVKRTECLAKGGSKCVYHIKKQDRL
ncbi:helix-turn-helix transcriptional regulator [Paenibacillus protaetiae]|uniref:Transcriptional regulator n=1 Tax=Paenibacillus protaetiae TaxID=2509456 RepID=A0A4V0YEV4_9BACL|nr:metalloregulator ArsR/SmtB family transcription factor [Paenibacillus protaetiae]QAY65521.1 transcriptional regulator [Paenibacillus protaetiae]